MLGNFRAKGSEFVLTDFAGVHKGKQGDSVRSSTIWRDKGIAHTLRGG
jgi:hypothetical protein